MDNPARPRYFALRSSTRFIGCVAFMATFTDGFIYSAVVPVLPFSLVARSNVPESDVQFWLSAMLIAYGVSYSAASPIAGWGASKSSSRQAQFLFALALAFGATILFCLGRNPWLLVLARSVQGVSGAFVYITALAITADHVNPDEIGAWIGFVLTGMNLGLLIAPFLAGLIYDNAGYYAVFAVVLAVIALDFGLRLLMIEKTTASAWLKDSEINRTDRTSTSGYYAAASNIGRLYTAHGESEESVPEVDETAPLLLRTKNTNFQLSEVVPVIAAILGSRRLRAATLGASIHMGIQTSFDAVLPLFVKRTFHWNSTGAGLIFLTITIPSLSGTFVGAITDRYGTRAVSLFGFAITAPAIALMGLVDNHTVSDKIMLCIFLVVAGLGMSFLLGPLAADLFKESEMLAERNPETMTKAGAFAQSFSVLNVAMGLAMAAGPGLSGLLYETTNWKVTTSVMAGTCIMGSFYVYLHTGKSDKVKGEIDPIAV